MQFADKPTSASKNLQWKVKAIYQHPERLPASVDLSSPEMEWCILLKISEVR